MSYRLDHIALLVRDLEESVRFLTEVLGLAEMANPMGGTAIRWIEIGDGRRFHVQEGDISRVHVEKQTHFALTASDFDAVLARFGVEGRRGGGGRGADAASTAVVPRFVQSAFSGTAAVVHCAAV